MQVEYEENFSIRNSTCLFVLITIMIAKFWLQGDINKGNTCYHQSRHESVG